MRVYLCLIAVFLIIGSPATAEEPANISKAEISAQAVNLDVGSQFDVKALIEKQLSAIRDRDDRAVYSLNAKDVNADFEDPQSFMREIRRKKPALYDHVSYEFLGRNSETSDFYKVSLIDKSGDSAMALFKIKQDELGTPRVHKIIVLQSEQAPL